MPPRKPPALPERKIKRYGWKPDLPDARDLLFAIDHGVLKTLPPAVDLEALHPKRMPVVVDQGQLGSCTANAVASDHFYTLRSEGKRASYASRLFIYYGERVMEGSVDYDAGAYIRDGFKVLVKWGAPPETDWPYTISKFAQRPPDKAFTDGLKHRATKYLRVSQTLTSMKACLAAGFPFVYGFTVYDSFESQQVANDGIVPLPGPTEGILGGHAVMCVGYDDATQRFKTRNSWGKGWGDHGNFHMPYAYLTDSSLSSDFWTLRVTA